MFSDTPEKITLIISLNRNAEIMVHNILIHTLNITCLTHLFELNTALLPNESNSCVPRIHLFCEFNDRINAYYASLGQSLCIYIWWQISSVNMLTQYYKFTHALSPPQYFILIFIFALPSIGMRSHGCTCSKEVARLREKARGERKEKWVVLSTFHVGGRYSF